MNVDIHPITSSPVESNAIPEAEPDGAHGDLSSDKPDHG